MGRPAARLGALCDDAVDEMGEVGRLRTALQKRTLRFDLPSRLFLEDRRNTFPSTRLSIADLALLRHKQGSDHKSKFHMSRSVQSRMPVIDISFRGDGFV